MFSAQVNIKFLLQLDERSWHWALIKVWQVCTTYSQRSEAWDCLCWDETESTSALSQSRASYKYLRHKCRLDVQFRPCFLLLPFSLCERYKFRILNQMFHRPHIVLDGHQLAMLSQLVHTKMKRWCPSSPRAAHTDWDLLLLRAQGVGEWPSGN